MPDSYIPAGKIGKQPLSKGLLYVVDVLTMAARELWQRGEADAARRQFRAGRQTVRQFLRERFGNLTVPA